MKYSAKTWTSDTFKPDLSFSVSYPLFERNTKLDAFRIRDLRLKAAETEREGYAKVLEAEYAAAFKGHAAREALLPVSLRRLESARIAVESLRESSRLGITPLMELLQAESDLRSQRKELVSLRIELLKLRASLGKRAGDPFLYLK
jgi:outer membrane protein TolC